MAPTLAGRGKTVPTRDQHVGDDDVRQRKTNLTRRKIADASLLPEQGIHLPLTRKAAQVFAIQVDTTVTVQGRVGERQSKSRQFLPHPLRVFELSSATSKPPKGSLFGATPPEH